MFARYSWYNRDSIYNEYLDSAASGTWFQFQSWQAVIDDVHSLNPTTVLNFRYAYNRFDRNSGQEEDARNFDLTSLGFPASYNSLVPEANRYFPRLDFDGTTMIDVAFGADIRPITSHSVTATVNKAQGAHTWKAGAEMRIYGERSVSTGNNQAGQYAFTNAYTRQNSATGPDFQGLQNYAAFLLGLPSTTSITRAAEYDEHSTTWGFYAHDDWRVGSRLTLNLGLRYEVETPLSEVENRTVSNFDFGYVQPIQGTVQTRYAALNDPALKALVPQINVQGGLMFVGPDTTTTYTTPKNSFLPRVGFAYQLDQKTVLRGGAGLFAGFLGQRRGDVIQPGYSQTTTIGNTFNANGAPIPYAWENALETADDSRTGRQRRRAADVRRQRDHVLQPQSGGVQAAPVADGHPARAGIHLVGGTGLRRQSRVRHRDRAEHQRPAQPVPEHRQLADGRDDRQQRLPVGAGRQPVRRPAAWNRAQQRDDRQAAAPAPVPGVRRHQHDQQRRVVDVPLPAGQPAAALLEGLHGGRGLHLLALDAGDGVPERG